MKRKKHRKPKAARNRTLARKRRKQLEYAKYRKRRARFYRRRQAIKNAKRRKKSVAYYRSLACDALPTPSTKRTGFSERHAAKAAAEKWSVSASTIRRWEKAYQQGGYQALMDKPKRPNTIHYQISFEVKLLKERAVALPRLW